MADQKANSAAIAQFGSALGPQVLAASRALYADVQQPLLDAQPAIARDCAYGPHPRHRLDLYRTGEASALRPVVLFVHGGGFVQGDKSADGWPNAAVGRWAAGQGWLGAVMNYRLAPDHGWPAGGEDVLAMGRPDNFALDFLPQAAAVAFMSAWVPVLVSRRDVARFSGQAPRPVQLITLRAGGFALAALVPGGLLAGAALALAWAPLALWPAVAIKLCFGGLFGALVTTLAIRRNAR